MIDRYIIPDLVPRGADPASLVGENWEEINTILVQSLGWFALRISRIIRQVHNDHLEKTQTDMRCLEKALTDMESVQKTLLEVGFYSDAHRDIWYPAYLYLIDIQMRSGTNEMDLQKHIRENLSAYVEGESVPIRGKDYEGLCDLLIRVDGNDCPMEVKLTKFDRKAKKQLRRYMEFYSAPVGYAAAPTLTTDLDPDMIFIDVSGWKTQH